MPTICTCSGAQIGGGLSSGLLQSPRPSFRIYDARPHAVRAIAMMLMVTFVVTFGRA